MDEDERDELITDINEIFAKLNRFDQGVAHYDKLGLPISLGEWVLRMEDPEYRVVAQTHIGDVFISTVWLGLDHNWGGGPPILFETMIFGGKYDGTAARYPTEAKARAGHEIACRTVRESE